MRMLPIVAVLAWATRDCGALRAPPPPRAQAEAIGRMPAQWLSSALSAAVAAGMLALSTEAAHARTLTQDEVAAKLSTVPVFAVTEKTGKPVFYDLDDGSKEGRFFVEYTGAQDAVRKIPSRLLKPADVSIRSLSLDTVYFQFVAQKFSINTQSSGRSFSIIPSPKATATAKQLLSQQPRDDANVPALNALNGAVPLFVEPTLQIRSEGGVDQLPVFFAADDLLATYARAAGGAAKPQIKVTDLQSLVARMQADASLDSEAIVFVPSSSALAVVDASARVEQERSASAAAVDAPLGPANTLSDEQIMRLPFNRGGSK